MNSANYQIIRSAIQNKQQIVATYKGLIRELCPHVIGTKAGREQALFYQFGGQSESRPIEPTGSPANWRCVPVDGLSNLSARTGAWHTASDHSKKQTCVDNVDVEITY
jgi:hypothetical protein